MEAFCLEHWLVFELTLDKVKLNFISILLIILKMAWFRKVILKLIVVLVWHIVCFKFIMSRLWFIQFYTDHSSCDAIVIIELWDQLEVVSLEISNVEFKVHDSNLSYLVVVWSVLLSSWSPLDLELMQFNKLASFVLIEQLKLIIFEEYLLSFLIKTIIDRGRWLQSLWCGQVLF